MSLYKLSIQVSSWLIQTYACALQNWPDMLAIHDSMKRRLMIYWQNS
jgi:hypothetical protein